LIACVPGAKQFCVPEQSKNSAPPTPIDLKSFKAIVAKFVVAPPLGVSVNVTVPVACPSPVAEFSLDTPDIKASNAIGNPCGAERVAR